MTSPSPHSTPAPRCLPAGDGALVIEFGDIIDTAVLARVTALDHRVAQLMSDNALPGVIETMPTFRSLAILFNPLLTSHEQIQDTLGDLATPHSSGAAAVPRRWQVPVCYHAEFGPDIESVAKETGLSPDDVVRLHHDTVYQVYMLGFLPGFAFMGDLAPELYLPRRQEPRVRVPRGTAAIAMQLTGIYPWECPGGWHLLGRSPLSLFNAHQSPPAHLGAGDQVQLMPVTRTEYDAIVHDQQNGTLSRVWTESVPGSESPT